MNSITRTFIPVTCLAAATLSCTRAHGPGEDGETHFLRACVDQCEGALTCLEGVCSAACESSDQCEKYDQTARCVDRSTGLDLEAGESDGMCDRRCTQQSDCVSLGATFGCESAVCREAVEPSPARSPDSGQGNGGTDGGVGDGDVIDSDAEVSRDGEAGRTNGGGEASVDLSPEAGSSSADGWSAVRSLSAAECPEWMPEPGDTCDRPRTPEGEGRCVYCPQDFAGPASVLDCDEAWFESSTDIQCEDLAEAERWVLMPMSSVAGCPEEMPRSERTCHVEDIDDGPGWCLYCHNDGSGTARPYGCDGGWFMYGPAIDCSSLIKGPEDLWCDPAGTWRIDYDSYDACGPSPTETETLTLSFDL